MLEYLLEGRRPKLLERHAISMALGLEAYTRSNGAILDGEEYPDQFSAVFTTGNGVSVGIRPIHPLAARSVPAALVRLGEATGILPRIYTSFDLLRRPFWVANDLFRLSKTLTGSS